MIDCIEEGERLRQLAELAIVEAPVDPLMERLCVLACGLLDMPMAYVTIVDDVRMHIKAHHGLQYLNIPREDAFCNVAIRSDAPLIVPDLSADPRFSENPYVAGDPHLRFYAGIPLAAAPGVRIGVLCIADLVPRDLTPEQVQCLGNLAGLVLGQIRHHAARQALARQAIELVRKQSLLAQTALLARVGGFEIETASGALSASDELRRLFGCGELTTLDELLSLVDMDARRELGDGLARLDDGEGCLDAELVVPGVAGTPRHVRVHAEAAMTPAGRKIVGIVQDITEWKKATGELKWLATHDSLTRVSNRAAFALRIEAAIRRADASGRRVALVALDVDRFKTINDTLGHDVGDHVLVAVAERLVAAVCRRGTVARLGGDEFGILVDEVEAEGAVAAVAADILAALRKPYLHEGHELGTRATLGIALSTLDVSCATSLFKDADIALYEAKKAGRDGCALFRASMREALEGRLGRLATARRLAAAAAIEPWYQPQVDLATGAIVGFEALLRCRDPRDGLRGPETFIEAFADPDVASTIGRLMREHVATDVAVTIPNAGAYLAETSVADVRTVCPITTVNGTGVNQTTTNTFYPTIEIEVSEAVFLGQRSGKAAAALRKLSEAGVSIAIDEFGAGVASLTQLRRHPIDRVKIAASLVRDSAASAEAASLVDAVAAIARSLGLGLVAEGIETPAQLAFLRACGCGLGQGRLFAKPMPGSRVPHFLRSWVMPGSDSEPRVAAFG